MLSWKSPLGADVLLEAAGAAAAEEAAGAAAAEEAAGDEDPAPLPLLLPPWGVDALTAAEVGEAALALLPPPLSTLPF